MMDWLKAITENLDIVVASIVIFLASADKIAMVAIKSLGNIKDTWRDTFPKKNEELQ